MTRLKKGTRELLKGRANHFMSKTRRKRLAEKVKRYREVYGNRVAREIYKDN